IDGHAAQLAGGKPAQPQAASIEVARAGGERRRPRPLLGEHDLVALEVDDVDTADGAPGRGPDRGKPEIAPPVRAGRVAGRVPPLDREAGVRALIARKPNRLQGPG